MQDNDDIRKIIAKIIIPPIDLILEIIKDRIAIWPMIFWLGSIIIIIACTLAETQADPYIEQFILWVFLASDHLFDFTYEQSIKS